LVEPQMRATKIPKVLGIDGKNKMSKSLDNHIELAATPKETAQRVRQMVTDPQRMRRDDPGNPDVCNVFTMHKIFSSQEEVAMVDTECRRAGIGCVDCKKLFAKNLNADLEPFRARRAEWGADPAKVWDVLNDGADRARVVARETISEVKEAIGLP
jgi:tryptophanyl-tRNA synthetase